ncbi:MAG: hypothetical protein JW720_02940 [Sedimentisphaerales bacterium]|nr:hypothetical protein [Sedimentisphaerales bacterium]
MKNGIKIAVLGVVVAAGIACIVLLSGGSGSRPPDAQDATAEQTAEFLASEKFVEMDKGDKEQYLGQINDSNNPAPMLTLLMNSGLSEEQRQKVMSNILPVISVGMNRRIDEFEALPPEKQTAQLDAIIDQLEQSRRGNSGVMFSPERMNLMLQYVDPHTRARLRKHLPEMRKRMEQRGIPTGDRPF